ncbi:MAG: PIN domain-containing protein [Deltaproteobacteria bacterium]|nr:PIN domain-containing protein [Deltaproteobacteria bacterium]
MSVEPGVVLDAGAFIALERRTPRMVAFTKIVSDRRVPLFTSAGVVAQVWRGGSGAQAAVAFLLRRTRVFDLTLAHARIVGRMLGASRTADPIDAHVVLLARQHEATVLTSDPDDLVRLDPSLPVERI